MDWPSSSRKERTASSSGLKRVRVTGERAVKI